MVYLFYSIYFSINYMSVLLNIRKSIFITIFILVLAKKKISLKELNLLYFILKQKPSYNYFKSFWSKLINFLSPNLNFLDNKV